MVWPPPRPAADARYRTAVSSLDTLKCPSALSESESAQTLFDRRDTHAFHALVGWLHDKSYTWLWVFTPQASIQAKGIPEQPRTSQDAANCAWVLNVNGGESLSPMRTTHS